MPTATWPVLRTAAKREHRYDPLHRLLAARGAGQKVVTEYRYDCQHRLSEVLLPNGQVAKYRYDAFGRRIEKDVAGAVTEFFWQGERLIGDWAPGRSRSYVYEPMSFRPLVMVDGDGAENAHPYYYQLDHLGTPQELTSAQGRICWSVRYQAYGNVARLDIEEVDNPLRFQGQYFDAETGLHYNRHRYYNPNTGRYLTADPIKLAGGLNSYRYATNPRGWIDPLGLSGNCPKPDTCVQEAAAPADNLPKIETKEPEIPEPKMTAEERRARIDVLSEANAKRHVQSWEDEFGMHTIGKHSPEIPDAALRQRAIDGTNPMTGKPPRRPRPSSSSQFRTWKLQMQAINEALTRKARGLNQFDGKDKDGNPIVRVEQPGSGRGYSPNKKDPNNPKPNEDMNGAEIKFDKNTQKPFTAFPTKQK
ncbi:RHS domain-containing protein [Pseudomonas sp. URMO17WK12:I11]|nr:RHS domain-containing protein [Pseudomonas sp. URMO17WK12:I11]